MVRHGVSAENHELGAGVVQLDEEVAEIVGELYHRGRGMNRQGIWARVHVGRACPDSDQLSSVSRC